MPDDEPLPAWTADQAADRASEEAAEQAVAAEAGVAVGEA